MPVSQLPHIILNEKVTGDFCATQKLIYFMLFPAKLSIARSWKRPSVHIALFRCKVSWIMLNEHLASRLTDPVPQF